MIKLKQNQDYNVSGLKKKKQFRLNKNTEVIDKNIEDARR